MVKCKLCGLEVGGCVNNKGFCPECRTSYAKIVAEAKRLAMANAKLYDEDSGA